MSTKVDFDEYCELDDKFAVYKFQNGTYYIGLEHYDKNGLLLSVVNFNGTTKYPYGYLYYLFNDGPLCEDVDMRECREVYCEGNKFVVT